LFKVSFTLIQFEQSAQLYPCKIQADKQANVAANAG